MGSRAGQNRSLPPQLYSRLIARSPAAHLGPAFALHKVPWITFNADIKMASKAWMVWMLAMAIFTIGAPAALADCSDRTYNCILSADVSYDSSTNQATTVTGGCSSGGGSTASGGDTDGSDAIDASDDTDNSDGTANLSASPSCNVGGSDSSDSSIQFLAKGTSAGTITQGRCFQVFSGCLPNNCGGSQAPEDVCNSKHPQCASSCTVVCTDACSNT